MRNNLGWLLWANLTSDLKIILVWLAINVMMVVSGIVKLVQLYGTPQEVAKVSTMFKTPVMVALFAKMPDVTLNTGILFAAIMLPIMAVLMGLMNLQLAIRGTRKMEESGETELLLSNAMTARTPVIAVALELMLINVVNGLTVGGALFAIKMDGTTTAGSLLTAVLLVLVGMVFAGIGLLGAQLFADSRSVTFFGYGVLATVHLVRSVIDVQDWKQLAWVSPLNWLENAQVYFGDNWQAVPALLLVMTALMGSAIWFAGRRDLGAGVFRFAGRGRRRAATWLRGFTTLFIKLELKTTLGWYVGIIVFAVMFGSLFASADDLLNDNQTIMKILGMSKIHQLQNELYANFLVMISMFVSYMSLLVGLTVMQRHNQDRRNGAFDLLGGQAVSRTRLYLTYMIGGIITSAIAWFGGMIIVWLIGNATAARPLPRWMLPTTLWGYWPTILLFLAIGAVLIGWLPKLFGVIYMYSGIMFLLTYLHNLLDLPVWFMRLSPFGWTLQIPAERVADATLWWLMGLAGVLLIIGYVGFQRRDLV